MGLKQLLMNIVPAKLTQLVSPTILQEDFSDLAVIVDVSSWQPKVDFQALFDMGVDGVAIRAFHPTNYTEGMAQYVIDKYYYERITALKKTKLFTMAYGVPAFVMDIQDYNNIPNTKAIMDKAWGPEQYRAHVHVIDAEINYFYRGSEIITVPAPNINAFFMNSLGELWNRYRRPPMLYSRVTWMEEATRFRTPDGNYDYYMRIALDNANKTQETYPLWLAYYPNNFNVNTPITHVDQVLENIPPITPVNRKYLEWGNSKWYMWQLGSKFLNEAITNTYGQLTGFDVSVVRHGAAEMWKYWGYEYPGTAPAPDPTPDPEPNPDLAELIARVEALEAFRKNVNEA